MPRGDRRAEILKVAERLFASERFHEVTLDDVAREARVGKGTIYRYFQDKDDLFFQTVTAALDDLCRVLKDEVPAEAPFREQLVTACDAVHAFIRRRWEAFRMVQTRAAGPMPHDKRLRGRFRAHLDAVADIIRRGVAAGEVRTDLPAEILAAGILAQVHMWVRFGSELPEGHDPVETIVDLFLHGAGRNTQKRKE